MSGHGMDSMCTLAVNLRIFIVTRRDVLSQTWVLLATTSALCGLVYVLQDLHMTHGY